MNTRIHTFSGTGFDPLNPCAQDVRLEDIAHALGNICRFGGHSPVFYSVAQHAVEVGRLMLGQTLSWHWTLLALHHDSAEAYLGDVVRPLKTRSGIYCGNGQFCSIDEVEDRIQARILDGLGIHPDPASQTMIRMSDDSVLQMELWGLFQQEPRMPGPPYYHWFRPITPEECLPPAEAARLFLDFHHDTFRKALAVLPKERETPCCA